MKHYCEAWLNEWCYENGWTDLYIERNNYWAFPPGAVIPEPLPTDALKWIKAEKGWSGEEKWWSIGAMLVTVVAAILTVYFQSPMPLGVAFAFAAVTVGLLEVELE
ncbi:slr1957 family protein [Coleofasciculus sp.]|uniref:slr1957 family protein n=1 Tax=Coleofasciculus sp. TaxID=3100458 RepID=UPI003A22DEDA